MSEDLADDDSDDDDSDLDDTRFEQVQLSVAFMFDCPECGSENFQRSISRHFDPSDPAHADIIEREWGAELLARSLEVQERVPSYRLVMSGYPRTVICNECFDRFAVVPPDRDDSFDSPDDL